MSEAALCKISHKFLLAEKSFQNQTAENICSAIVLAINEAWSLNEVELGQIHIVLFRSIRENKVMKKRGDWGIILCDYLFEIILSVLIVLDMIPFFLSSVSGWIVLHNPEGLTKWIKKQFLYVMRPQFHCRRYAADLQKNPKQPKEK